MQDALEECYTIAFSAEPETLFHLIDAVDLCNTQIAKRLKKLITLWIICGR